MWISKKKYKELIDENQYLKVSLDSQKSLCNYLAQRLGILSNENKNMEQELQQLKVQYADEVKKNFELANYLSEMNNK